MHISSPLQEAQVTVDCVIHRKHHRSILGPKGSNVQAITQEYNVTIKFPDRESKQEKVQYMSVFLFLFYSTIICSSKWGSISFTIRQEMMIKVTLLLMILINVMSL